VREWFKGWVPHREALALIAELRRAQGRLPAKPFAVVAKANSQSNQRALEVAKEALQEAQLRRQQDEYVRRAQIANEQAVELGYLQRQWDALASRRYDPTGNWGPPTLASRENW
jgi:hypothetical protein